MAPVRGSSGRVNFGERLSEKKVDPFARAKTLQQHSHMHWLSRPLTELTQLGESNNYTEKSWRARLGGFPYRRKRVARPFVRRSRWKSSGRRVTPGITFLHKSGALDYDYKLLFYFTVRCVSRVLVQFTGVEFAEGLSQFSSLFWSAKHEHHKMFVFSLF